MQPQRKAPVPAVHLCPVCGHKQTKIQRLVGAVPRGSTAFICARAGDCSVGISVSKIANWVEVPF
jgi:hypothetical protein